MRRQTKHALAAFGKSFGITLLAMGVVLATICFAFYTRARRPQDPQEELPTAYLPRDEDRLSIFIAGAEDGVTPPDVYLLMGFLPDKGRIALCLLPPATYVEYGGEASTLGSLYQRGGSRYAQQALAGYLGIPLDRWAKVEVEELSRMMNMTGLMDYYLPVDLNAQLHGRTVVMPKGNYQLDGRKAADILAYPAYKGGEVERSDRGALLLSQLVGENLPAFLTDVGDALIQTVLDTVDTDLSWKDYEERKSAMVFLAKLDLPATAVVYIDGSSSRDRGVFYLSPGCISRIQEMYGAPGGGQPAGEPSPASILAGG